MKAINYFKQLKSKSIFYRPKKKHLKRKLKQMYRTLNVIEVMEEQLSNT